MKLVITFFLLALVPLAQAQQSTTQPQSQEQPNSGDTNSGEQPFEDQEDHRRFWQASLPGGEFVVALDRISSISKHQYLLDGSLIITEVTIDTVGNALTRIYQITPASEYSNLSTAQKIVERGNDLLDRAGQRTGTDLQTMVQKKYPVTTHSKSVEYRVADLGTLDALFGSVNRAWKTGKGRKFRVK